MSTWPLIAVAGVVLPEMEKLAPSMERLRAFTPSPEPAGRAK